LSTDDFPPKDDAIRKAVLRLQAAMKIFKCIVTFFRGSKYGVHPVCSIELLSLCLFLLFSLFLA
jgi:hypothetical protein